MGKLFLLAVGVLISVVVVYQSGERKTVQRLEHPAHKVLDAAREFTDETGNVFRETGEALGVPQVRSTALEAKKKLEELSKE